MAAWEAVRGAGAGALAEAGAGLAVQAERLAEALTMVRFGGPAETEGARHAGPGNAASVYGFWRSPSLTLLEAPAPRPAPPPPAFFLPGAPPMAAPGASVAEAVPAAFTPLDAASVALGRARLLPLAPPEEVASPADFRFRWLASNVRGPLLAQLEGAGEAYLAEVEAWTAGTRAFVYGLLATVLLFLLATGPGLFRATFSRVRRVQNGVGEIVSALPSHVAAHISGIYQRADPIGEGGDSSDEDVEEGFSDADARGEGEPALEAGEAGSAGGRSGARTDRAEAEGGSGAATRPPRTRARNSPVEFLTSVEAVVVGRARAPGSHSLRTRPARSPAELAEARSSDGGGGSNDGDAFSDRDGSAEGSGAASRAGARAASSSLHRSRSSPRLLRLSPALLAALDESPAPAPADASAWAFAEDRLGAFAAHSRALADARTLAAAVAEAVAHATADDARRAEAAAVLAAFEARQPRRASVEGSFRNGARAGAGAGAAGPRRALEDMALAELLGGAAARAASRSFRLADRDARRRRKGSLASAASQGGPASRREGFWEEASPSAPRRRRGSPQPPSPRQSSRPRRLRDALERGRPPGAVASPSPPPGPAAAGGRGERTGRRVSLSLRPQTAGSARSKPSGPTPPPPRRQLPPAPTAGREEGRPRTAAWGEEGFLKLAGPSLALGGTTARRRHPARPRTAAKAGKSKGGGSSSGEERERPLVMELDAGGGSSPRGEREREEGSEEGKGHGREREARGAGGAPARRRPTRSAPAPAPAPRPLRSLVGVIVALVAVGAYFTADTVAATRLLQHQVLHAARLRLLLARTVDYAREAAVNDGAVAPFPALAAALASNLAALEGLHRALKFGNASLRLEPADSDASVQARRPALRPASARPRASRGAAGRRRLGRGLEPAVRGGGAGELEGLAPAPASTSSSPASASSRARPARPAAPQLRSRGARGHAQARRALAQLEPLAPAGPDPVYNAAALLQGQEAVGRMGRHWGELDGELGRRVRAFVEAGEARAAFAKALNGAVFAAVAALMAGAYLFLFRALVDRLADESDRANQARTPAPPPRPASLQLKLGLGLHLTWGAQFLATIPQQCRDIPELRRLFLRQ
eukprot:tig00000514_g1796.t1